MSESDYHRLADAALDALYELLEEADENGSLDVESQDGVMTIGLPTGQQYIINKHAVSRELWLSSPVSGGLHFAHKDGEWTLSDGRTLKNVLLAELKTIADIEL